MTPNNEKKNRLLGMPHGTACAKLRKAILFHLLQKFNMNTCFQCGQTISEINTLSIEHKQPWQQATNSRQSFFDLDNIAFSHLRCNCRVKSLPEISSQNTTGFMGVHCDKTNKTFRASIQRNGEKWQSKSYHTPQEAHLAYIAYKKTIE